MDAIQIIKKKREGSELSSAEIQYLIEGYTAGRIPDYQMAAFLMAAQLRGMALNETITLTQCMLNSGRILDFSAISTPVVDKHSTGGVGDKISLVLTPIVGACGVRVPMISGRALGHTGGTLDKLESIPGFRTNLQIHDIYRQIRELGVAMIGATKEIAPADRQLYALRDVTASVDFIPFITASILSKKLAEGIDGLVLDVKLGRGAFMRMNEEARELAETLVSVGEHFGMSTIAWLTNMNIPLGRAIGNWLEVEESINCLRGEGPEDVLELSLKLSGEMIALADLAGSPEEGEEMAQAAVQSGHALNFLAKIVEAQGGDPAVIHDPALRMRTLEPQTVTVPLDISGYVSDVDAFTLAEIGNSLGVGRLVIDDKIDPEAGIVLHLRPGERATPGQPLASFYTRKTDQPEQVAHSIFDAFKFSKKPVDKPNILIDRLTFEGWASDSREHNLISQS
ncbi:MAG: thymidine phosphorylase [Rhodothermaceae bacterium]|nr:thymidine phosphorylase [Rhodothermaceae bacterium]MXW31970.1 thymidine phosphorylase [Rhodothermaceae bacterium]MXZ16670.1 thymidine phosphorylase [Rhodothermaceae bacterium]MYC05237.1 thymidine phosphorylase [Rhodothermaceae bacterium]MYE62167.1 thymidine phosphorylase [Rhodothermaceae bacterium]